VSKVVLDASAFLAFANGEPGAEKVQPVLPQAVLSTVNSCEIMSKLVRKGMTLARAGEYVRQFVSEVIPFDFEQASIAAGLEEVGRPLGLSLGDRACLALGKRLNVQVLTAERSWAKLEIGIPIELIRDAPSH
jgi:ribonuclease VapC